MKIRTLFIAWLLMLPLAAQAELTIKITGGNVDAISIAIAPFEWAGGETPPTADFDRIISDDLQRSGEFKPHSRLDQPQAAPFGQPVNYATWRDRGINNLVTGKVTGVAGRYRVEFALHDTAGGSQVTTDTVYAAIKDQRFAAHHVADLVYEALTGERGAFATRIAFVVANRTANSLQVSDSDGHGAKTILATNDPIMSPSWSPDGKKLAYVSFEGDQPAIYVQNVESGSRRKLTSFKGINGAPSWSPDGSRLAVTLSKDGDPDIYVLYASGSGLQRITESPGIDTESSWSPDGNSLIFTSDRGGTPQIYRVSAAGGAPARLTFEGKYNSNASFAPDGKSITLVTRTSAGYQVAILDLETGGMQMISDGPLDESSSIAPNGKMVIYASGLQGTLHVAATDYDVETRLAAQSGDVRNPAWSPFLINRR